ncbi:MAG: galactitol-1-phosphate 5-dehydrogenase [Eubacterium sp.]|nr:galactitol-1-phosphate 5-dehydrogenase [Eubacterium sp.]
MRAYVLKKLGEISLEDVAAPVPAEGEVLVRVRAAGICGSDVPRVYTKGTYHYPLIPGHEFAGVTSDGRRVGVFPLIPCGECAMCRKKLYELCRSYDYIGSRRDGAFAEYVSVPEKNLLEIPDDMPFKVAAMLEPMSVALHSVRRAGDPSGKTAVVLGAGTIGLCVVMMLRALGASRVCIIAGKDVAVNAAAALGLDEVDIIRSRGDDGDYADLPGFDMVFECVGKARTLSQAVGLCNPCGSLVAVGNPYGDMALERDVYWKILRNQLTVTGTWNSSYTGEDEDDWHTVVRLYEEGKIDPGRLITHSLAFDELIRGLEIMRDKSDEYIKVMITEEDDV